MESQEHLVPSSPSSAASGSPSSSSAPGNSSSDSGSISQGDEDATASGGMEGEVEEAEGLISQTEVGEYELVDLHQQLGTCPILNKMRILKTEGNIISIHIQIL